MQNARKSTTNIIGADGTATVSYTHDIFIKTTAHENGQYNFFIISIQ